jgi:hypothetical protein
LGCGAHGDNRAARRFPEGVKEAVETVPDGLRPGQSSIAMKTRQSSPTPITTSPLFVAAARKKDTTKAWIKAMITVWTISSSHWSTIDQATPSVRLKKANRMAQANEMKVKPWAIARHSPTICSKMPKRTSGQAENKRCCAAPARLRDCARCSSLRSGKKGGDCVLSKKLPGRYHSQGIGNDWGGTCGWQLSEVG